jgi:hypothetical protein
MMPLESITDRTSLSPAFSGNALMVTIGIKSDEATSQMGA